MSTKPPKNNSNKSFEELKQKIAILNQLLQNPEPGLFSWNIAYADQMKWIVDYWNNN